MTDTYGYRYGYRYEGTNIRLYVDIGATGMLEDHIQALWINLRCSKVNRRNSMLIEKTKQNAKRYMYIQSILQSIKPIYFRCIDIIA